jgi:glycosyltransferase involved in cell wall biosynthesis
VIRVLAVSAQGRLSPGMRVRAAIPSRGLREHGVDVAQFPLFTSQEYATFQRASLPMRSRLALRARQRLLKIAAGDDAGITWILRRADMLPLTGLESRLVASRRFIYDVDDAIWFDGVGAGGHPLAFLKGSHRKAKWLAARADHVIAGNEILADWLSDHASTVSVIPSLVDPDAVPIRRHAPSDQIVIGWIGSATTAPYLMRTVSAIERAAKLLQDVRLIMHVVGGIAPPVRGVRSIQEPWNERTEQGALASIDIGVMPLPDNRWTRGKCAYKAVQYMASGIPVIADDVGVTADVVGDAGVVTSEPDEWVEGIVQLAQDHYLRTAFGSRGRSRAANAFSVRAWAPRIAKVLTGA